MPRAHKPKTYAANTAQEIAALARRAGTSRTKLTSATRDQSDWQNRSHFFAVSADIMRHVLVDHAPREGARKREAPPVANPESAIKNSGAFVDLLAVDEALNALAGLDPRKARILDLLIFGGLDLKETAEALEVSIPTIVRESRLASAWMARELASRQPAAAI